VVCKGLCGWEAGYEGLLEHGAGSGEHKDKQSRYRRAPILGAAALWPVGLLGIWHRRRGNPPPSCALGPWGRHSGWWAKW